MSYDFGPEHPLRPARMMLAYMLIDEYGIIDGYDTKLIKPSCASEEELLLVHTPEYIEAVKKEEPDLAFGLGSEDTPVFHGIYDASRLIAGSSIEAAKLMVREDCKTFNLGGGLHHALPTAASGFCVFNDIALAICILKKKFRRILYIDIDAHHGDGVQHIFYDDPGVLKVSLHESGKYLFPGTGFIEEVGMGEGRGYSVNIPMPMYAGDEEYCLAFEQIVPELFEWFKPEIVVAQIGVDAHYSDPMTSLNLTLNGYNQMVLRIRELTDKHASGRLLALGGGGYNPEVVPIAWASALQIMNGKEAPEFLPPWWVEMFLNTAGKLPLSPPDVLIKVPSDRQKRISAELDETLERLKKILTDNHTSTNGTKW